MPGDSGMQVRKGRQSPLRTQSGANRPTGRALPPGLAVPTIIIPIAPGRRADRGQPAAILRKKIRAHDLHGHVYWVYIASERTHVYFASYHTMVSRNYTGAIMDDGVIRVLRRHSVFAVAPDEHIAKIAICHELVQRDFDRYYKSQPACRQLFAVADD
jgi:hypothetical protein